MSDDLGIYALGIGTVAVLTGGLIAINIARANDDGSKSSASNLNAKVRVVFGLFVGVVLGVLVSQYSPIFGSAFELIGQPWSPARMSLMGTHVLAFAVAGAGLAFLVTWLGKQSEASAPVAAPVAASVAAPNDVSSRLAEVDRVYAQGLMTKSEYDAKRAELLKSL
ncbi:MAG: SHOCT domain-containing protein [Labilithrix sp.]|nr:SHOCT domain-containing protein [Labilithrix sp.]